ncbi:RING-H2 finger protein ATL65 [Cicer arietinum]|uniref:RING-type E3 ubiquitin transferase n=1 Tax=Cicer arietinum TaxID=3827 RepID=A0A1S2YDN6_CICAR|nr:RING-H2 finger protein ATL65 [Cicer arietinum]
MIAPAQPPMHNQQPPISPNSPAVDFTPPLIAMVVVVAAAFLFVTYSRLISRHLTPPIHRLIHHFQRRRFLPPSSATSLVDVESLQYDSTTFDAPHTYGLDESVIKTIPFFIYTTKYEQESRRDCAVCLLEFEDHDYVRTLPLCYHTFHLDCIDAWLRSHANCPLCRAGLLCSESESPFRPLMAARIRPSFHDQTINLHLETPFHNSHSVLPAPDITPQSPVANNVDENRFQLREDFLLKRSYSFGFERSLPSERMVIDPATTSPWRYRRGNTGFWSKRPSPFGSLGKSRVFSFRYYRGMKSPFFRRRGFFPLSESSVRYGEGGSWSRRSKSIASPMFSRSSAAVFSSSRLRCGDPEALLSPERFNRRR